MNSRPLCHTLSNAFEISKNIPLTSTEGLLWKLDCISWMMARILAILELSGRKTDCQGWKSLLNKQVKQGIIDYPFKYFANSSETDAPREIDVDWTWILRWYVEEQISTNFHVIFTYFFEVILLIEKSMSFPRTFFSVISIVKKSTLFPSIFFGEISLVKKFT